MANNSIIKVEGLGKKYMLNKSFAPQSDTLYGTFLNRLKNLKQVAKKKETEEFWALRDVSFEIKQGDRVGIIGRNGAGKSTLLKILSRITPPTTGRIELGGRVASLLEVGTGFHGDLSGRENIYLNGSILGMTQKEITKKFDEIIAFAEIEKFLDTPVKRYSSGMYVRLAFAVAAHLEPDILIVDEVLAVGDASFQEKCLGKMKDVSREGRTVLFVSHNMASLTNLCSQGIVLQKGKIDLPLSDIHTAVNHYLQLAQKQALIDLKNRTDRDGEGKIRLISFSTYDQNDSAIDIMITGNKVIFKINYECINNPNPTGITVAIAIYGSDGTLFSVLGNEFSSRAFATIPQQGTFSCVLEKLPVTSGSYIINLAVSQNGIMQDWVQEAAKIVIEDGDYYGTGKIVPSTHRSILIENNWGVNEA